MKPGLSKREKTLISVMAVALVAFVMIRFVIIPVNNTYTTALQKRDFLSEEVAFLDAKIASETLIRSSYKNAKAIYEDIKTRYPMVMSNEEIDRILTRLCRENGFHTAMMGISNPNSTGVGNSTSGQSAVYEGPFIIATITMRLSGSYDSLKDLVDAIAPLDHVRIRRFAFLNTTNTSSASAPNITVNFEVIMLNADSAPLYEQNLAPELNQFFQAQ